jgi:hypothetical protein
MKLIFIFRSREVFFQSKHTYLMPIEMAAGLGILFLARPLAGPISKSSANCLLVAEFERHPGRRKDTAEFCFD